LTCFMLQVVTGILLALIYVPSAGEAWNSLQTLNHGISLGWFIRALHGWGSNFMVAIVLIHMVQVFLFGAYKFPRELTWIVGVLLLLLTLGMDEWPMPGRIVRRATYMQEYHELTHKQGVPFVPGAVGKDIVFSGFILHAIAACALYFGPFGPSGQPDPTIIQTAPRPDFFFLWLYALLSFLPPSAETPILLIGPAIGIIVLLALPFFAGEGEKSWKRRPIAVLTILLTAVALGTMTHLGQ